MSEDRKSKYNLGTLKDIKGIASQLYRFPTRKRFAQDFLCWVWIDIVCIVYPRYLHKNLGARGVTLTFGSGDRGVGDGDPVWRKTSRNY